MNRFSNIMLRWFPALLLLCGAAACTSHTPDISEQEPDPDNAIQVTTSAKGTGTAFLTNVKEIGPFDGSGRITCMVIDKADSNHFIAGAASGGLWVSHNRGRTWTPIDDQLPTLNIQSITQNPIQTNTYYAATNTYMLASPSTTVYRPDVYKSTDGGQSFQLVPASAGTFSAVARVVCSPTSASTLYALSDIVGAGEGLYRSTDNGQTFAQVLQTSGGVNDLEVLPNGTVLVTANAQVFRSATGNAGTFTATLNGAAGTHTFSSMDIAYCQNQPLNVYGVSTGGNSGVGMFKSTDGGQSWTFLQSLVTSVVTRAIGVKPDDPDYLFAGSLALYISQNAGSSFSVYSVGGVDYWSVNFDPHNANKVFVTFDQGIVEVGLNPFNPNNNTAYIRRDTLLNSAQIYAGDHFVTGDKVIAGMQDRGTAAIYPGGDRSLGSNDGGFCFFHKQDTTIAYGSYQNGQIFKKTNIQIPFPQPGFTNPVSVLNELDANNDNVVDEGANFIQSFWMNSADGEQLYYPTKKRLWRSTNGGAHWVPISGFYNIPASSVETFMDGNGKANPIIYWSVTDTLYVMPGAKTAVAGNEFRVKLPVTVRTVRVDPTNDSIVYITSHGGTIGARVYRSSNLFKGAVQWTSLTGDLPDQVSVRCFEVNPLNKNQMVIGTNAGLYVSGNGGAHWDKESQFPNVNILHTSMRPSDKRLFVYTYGRGAWAASFPANTGVNNSPADVKLTVWPNPSNGVVHVEIPSKYDHCTIQVWAADGRCVKTIANIRQSQQAIDLSGFPAGTYVIGLYQGGSRLAAGSISLH